MLVVLGVSGLLLYIAVAIVVHGYFKQKILDNTTHWKYVDLAPLAVMWLLYPFIWLIVHGGPKLERAGMKLGRKKSTVKEK